VKAMILAAGRGERMGEMTQKIPKPLTKIGHMTLLEHNLRRVKSAGIIDVVINISWLGEQIEKYLEEIDLGLNVTIFDEGDNMLGTGGGIKQALSVLGKDPFYLVNADVFSDYEVNRSMSLQPGVLGHLVLVPNPPHHQRGDFCLEGKYLNGGKDQHSNTFSGISLLSPDLLSECAGEIFPLEPVLDKAAEKGLLTGEIHKGVWLDVGAPERLVEAERIMLQDKFF
jgi:N-acetyl-alpha-D-muramate 1-phosphate uridylyltransferase